MKNILAALAMLLAGFGAQAYAAGPVIWSENVGPSGSGYYRNVAVADVNSDGTPDLVAGGVEPGGVMVWLGRPAGAAGTAGAAGFDPAPPELPPMGEVRAVGLVDVDLDGVPELVTSSTQILRGLHLWRAEGSGYARRAVSEAGGYERAASADVNGDGRPDIIAAGAESETQGGVSVFLGDGKGGFTEDVGPTRKGVYRAVAAADFDADGLMDLAASGWGASGGLTVWYGGGEGRWSPGVLVDTGEYWGLDAADFDGDGLTDIAASRSRDGVTLWHNRGGRGFVQRSGPASEGSYWEVRAADMDGDGRADLAATRFDGGGVGVWLSRGSGWSDAAEGLPEEGAYYGLAVADLDGDGRMDIAASRFGEGVKVWLQGATRPAAEPGVPEAAEAGPSPSEVSENRVFTTRNGVPEYKLGPGDAVEITVSRGAVSDTYKGTVSVDGEVAVGFARVRVDGLTPSEAARAVERELGQYIIKPAGHVEVVEYRSKTVTLLGAVRSHQRQPTGPGVYSLRGRTTVLELLGLAGGPAERANLEKVQINRKGGTVYANLYRVLTLGEKDQDVVLDDGDTVYIPESAVSENRVFVLGEVKEPGVYPFSQRMGLLQAVMLAKGYSQYALTDEVRIIRGDPATPEIIEASVEDVFEDGARGQDVALMDNDIVYVPRSTLGDWNVFVDKLMPTVRLLTAPLATATDVKFLTQ